jgi:HAD superfamily hydrolase (TIGR01509 family)
MPITLVLDAMGVIFASADDVVELLQPFIINHGGESNPDRVSDLYVQASLGRITPDDFWHLVGLDPSVEDEYLSLHQLTAGLLHFLENRPPSVTTIWCLSNDVGRWSTKLRSQFKLDQFLNGAIISGDVGTRKPEPAIYQILLSRTGVPADQIVFVDDRPKNLTAARDLGIQAVHFGETATLTTSPESSARSFAELAELLKRPPSR